MRCVRSFWIEAVIDGQRSKLRGGPRAHDGGLILYVYQRVDGEPRRVLRIDCIALSCGRLRTQVERKCPETGEATTSSLESRR